MPRPSPSRSSPVTVAVSVPLVWTVDWSIETDVTTGAEFATVTAAEVTASEVEPPSEAVTRTAMSSPRSPLPETPRSSVAPVSPARSTPPFVH